MNMDDIFSQFGDIFGSAFGGGGGFEAVVEASVELKEVTYIKVKLTLEEIANGVEKR
jgi:molecular chaperone DnaJ